LVGSALKSGDMDLWSTIVAQLKATKYLEWIAFVTALLQVFFAIKNKAINYFFGIISVIIFVYLYFVGKLYAEGVLNFYYLIVSIWGWIMWTNKKTNFQRIGKASLKENLLAIGIFVFTCFLTYFILSRYTNSNVPLWDSVVSAFAWVGTWLMTRRKIENWLWLTASNICAIPLLHSKEYEATALLTLILLVMGIIGYFRWRKEIVGH
jgi:nicotinamide mononucleotide transporter